MSIPFQTVAHEGIESLSVYVKGQLHLVSSVSHPLYRNLREGLVHGFLSEDEVLNMITQSGTRIARTLTSLTDKVTFDEESEHLLFEGEKMDNVLSRHILRLVRCQGIEAARPWARFMEKLSQNPSRLSRIHLYSWLEAEGDFTITSEGDILGYKAVRRDRFSKVSGKEEVRVNGVVHQGRIPNPDGAVVEMDRHLVHDSRDVACSVGLHVGTYDYAANIFGSAEDLVLLVAVNPRDAVAVPRDHGAHKMRVCRYEVLAEASRRSRVRDHVYEVPSDEDEDEDETPCTWCGFATEYGDDDLCDDCDDDWDDDDWS